VPKRDAARMGRAAFFAPLTRTVPRSGPRGRIIISDIWKCKAFLPTKQKEYLIVGG